MMAVSSSSPSCLGMDVQGMVKYMVAPVSGVVRVLWLFCLCVSVGVVCGCGWVMVYASIVLLSQCTPFIHPLNESTHSPTHSPTHETAHLGLGVGGAVWPGQRGAGL